MINDSQFSMWRSIFAVAHADGVVSDEEVRFMAETLELLPFSEEQRGILSSDIKEVRDVEEMFAGITDSVDQAEFFNIAHKLVHVDGDYSAEEQEMMLKLKQLHLSNVNLDELVGQVDLQLEGDQQSTAAVAEPSDTQGALKFFRDMFLNKIQKN